MGSKDYSPSDILHLTGKRGVHINLSKWSYVKLKICTFERQLTLQDAFAGFAALVASGDDRAVKILDELALQKYDGSLKNRNESSKLSDVDRDLLYDIMRKDATTPDEEQ